VKTNAFQTTNQTWIDKIVLGIVEIRTDAKKCYNQVSVLHMKNAYARRALLRPT
jgi:hypothetical protein